MPNKANPEVPIMLDKPRNLRLDLNAMEAFEEKTGHSFIGGDKELLDYLNTAKGAKAFLWACLVHEDAELTLEQVGKLIDYPTLRVLDASMKRAYNLATPEPEDGQSPPAQPLPPG